MNEIFLLFFVIFQRLFDVLNQTEKKLNLDAFAPFVCDESKPLQMPWQKAEAKRQEEWEAALKEHRVNESSIRQMPLKKKMNVIKETRATIQVAKTLRGDWKRIVEKLRSLFCKRREAITFGLFLKSCNCARKLINIYLSLSSGQRPR